MNNIDIKELKRSLYVGLQQTSLTAQVIGGVSAGKGKVKIAVGAGIIAGMSEGLLYLLGKAPDIIDMIADGITDSYFNPKKTYYRLRC